MKTHFTVDPDGITKLIREMWAEGSYEKALNVLGSMACGVTIPTEIQYDILRGKKRFANYKGDPDQFCIVADKWKPRRGDYYPDPEPAKLAAYLQKRSDEEADRQYHRTLRGWGVQPEDELLDDEPKATVTFHGNAIDMSKVKMYGGYDTLEQMNMALLVKRKIEKMDPVADMHSRDEREKQGKPKPDRKLAANSGWILPDGKFYACLTAMEHVWLAGQFGLSEKAAEQRGWIKINRDLLDYTNILHFKPPTQKQLDTLFDWCEAHKVELPEWATSSK